MINVYRSKSLNALSLDSVHSFDELHVVEGVGVLDEPSHQQVEVLWCHNHADVVQDAGKVRKRNATIVFCHLEYWIFLHRHTNIFGHESLITYICFFVACTTSIIV